MHCNLSQVSHPPPWLNRPAVMKLKNSTPINQKTWGQGMQSLQGFIIIALKIRQFCLRGGLGKVKCQQRTFTSCSTCRNSRGSAEPSYGSAFSGQKGPVGQGCCGTWGRARAGQEGGTGLWGQESFADVEAKPELGQFQSGISITEEEAWVQFWSEIWSFPSLGISGIHCKTMH